MRYMLGSVISVFSPALDIHDLLEPLNIDNIDDIFTAEASANCLEVSKQWLKQTQRPEFVEFEGKKINIRPPTMFGEPHVIKSIRLRQLEPTQQGR